MLQHIVQHLSKAVLPGLAIAGFLAASPTAEPVVPATQIRVALIVCGGNGCAPVQTKQQTRRKFQTMGHG
jgi:hypothetical protein